MIAPCPVIGLTIDPKSLIAIRRHRLQLIGQPGFVTRDSGEYVDYEAVEKELVWAKRLCNARGMADHRCDAPLHRGDRGDGAQTHGCVARKAWPPGGAFHTSQST